MSDQAAWRGIGAVIFGGGWSDAIARRKTGVLKECPMAPDRGVEVHNERMPRRNGVATRRAGAQRRRRVAS